MSDINDTPDHNTLLIAQGFCAAVDGIIYCLEENCFYMYEKGVYRKIFDKEMQDFVLTKKSLTRKMTLQNLKNVIERIAMIKRMNLENFNNDSFFNFENGLYDFENFKLLPHDPKVFSTIRIPYKYDPVAKCMLWEKSLNEITENDKNKIRTIQEFFGYCLTRDTKYEKALLLVGEGANGKSTILSVLENMVGPNNCSALSLRFFNNPQKTSVLKGKLVNICGEVPKRIEDYESEFKTIVTGEKLTVSPKYVPDYTILPFCKLILAVNEFPHIDDKTSAFYRRLLVIDLVRQFVEEEQNKNLRFELLVELPGIFNWSIEGLKRLRERGTFLIDEYMKQSIENIKEMNNPIIAWARENIMVIKGDELVKGDAFEDYKKWSEKNGYRPFGSNKFSAELYKIFSKDTERSRRRADSSRQHIWPHLAFRTPENEARAMNQDKQVDVKWEE